LSRRRIECQSRTQATVGNIVPAFLHENSRGAKLPNKRVEPAAFPPSFADLAVPRADPCVPPGNEDDRLKPTGPASPTGNLLMSKHVMNQPAVRAKTAAWITAVLSAAAAVAVLFGVSLAVSPEDNERFESVLVLAVARQLLRGPWELYGPYGGSNPLVIITHLSITVWPRSLLGRFTAAGSTIYRRPWRPGEHCHSWGWDGRWWRPTGSLDSTVSPVV
jgi:hypothetical protein